MVMSTRYNTTFELNSVELGIMVSLNIIFSAGGIVGNLFVCFAFLLHRNLRNNMNIFIFSLACADLLVCLVAQPMFVASLLQNHPQDNNNTLSENIRKRLTWISLLASIGNLFGVTLDRYFIISNPLKYAARVTKKFAFIFIAVVWLFSLILGSISESYREAKVIGQLYVFVLLAAFTIPLYFRILCIARRHARLIHATMCQVNFTMSAIVQRSNLQKADRNSLKTVGIISIIFVVGWFPLLILPFLYRGGNYDRGVLLEALQWANTLALSSSACNPVVYTWRDRRVRKAVTTVYARWRAKRSVSIDSATCVEKFEMKTVLQPERREHAPAKSFHAFMCAFITRDN